MSVVIVKERRQKLKSSKKYKIAQFIMWTICFFAMSYFSLFSIKWIIIFIIINCAFENIWDWIFNKKNKNQK